MAKRFVEIFSNTWLMFIALIPYFLISFALSAINVDLGFGIFKYLFSFVGFSIVLMIRFALFKNEKIQTNGIKEFIGSNAKKVFHIGVIIFYSILILSVLIKFSYIFEVLMLFIFSLFTFPILRLMLNVGYKFLEKIKETINEDMLSENTLQDKGL